MDTIETLKAEVAELRQQLIRQTERIDAALFGISRLNESLFDMAKGLNPDLKNEELSAKLRETTEIFRKKIDGG